MIELLKSVFPFFFPKKPDRLEVLRILMEEDYQWVQSDRRLKAMIERYHACIVDGSEIHCPEDIFKFRRRVKATPLSTGDFLGKRNLPVQPVVLEEM